MYDVTFRCPECGHSSVDSFGGVVHGDAGIWLCDHCRRVWEININFRRMAVANETGQNRTELRREAQ